jgi:hypothetical protein
MSKCSFLIMSSLILVLLLGMGCVSTSPAGRPGKLLQDQTTYETSMNSSQNAGLSNPASVYITYPEFDGGVHAGNVTVTVQVRNFSVVTTDGIPVTPGEGHIICFKDVTPLTDPGFPVKNRTGTVQVSYQTSCTWNNVTEGTHTFSVELVNNDDTPLVPPVIDAVDVTAVVPSG